MTTDQLFNDLFKEHPNHFRSLEALRNEYYKDYHSKIAELLKSGELIKDDHFIWWNENKLITNK